MREQLLFFDKLYFNFYKALKSEEGKEIISITDGLLNFDKINEVNEDIQIVDISSLSGLDRLQYNAELVFPKFPLNTIFIADKEHKKLFEHELRYCFEDFVDIDLIEDIDVEYNDVENTVKSKKLNHRKIIDLDSDEIEDFVSSFKNQIYGHQKFKDDFTELIRNFRVFNKLGEHKILSLFLMGDSGVGKTEVARAIHKSLGGKKKLAKINFGNYSSDNSLNSLIGSPRGYIGSEGGELFIRVKDSDIGIILIDEFEKSNSTLFNYFLDVLESGKMVSSIAEEIDLNGFIIIFTSNINKDEFPKRISPELRSRFDYKGYFMPLFHSHKEKFTEFRIKNIIEKFNKNFDFELPENIANDILNRINVSNYKNMRDLNKKIKDTFVKSVMELLAKNNE
ncbi:AAA family ATPase [Flagellimonas halotolerans]|uniref:AAA family ATPase n=1 Tax=Flagellimonas halotolerans TaxID=3112164 RepID=A0ABU6IRC7_9FLAO|nr:MULTISPECIES: AAA family ATPase [unclassified Allomuricauda]MEC3965675.1 AAA family ATPase [Muricauda sp. SYSU M86414]MEC4265542.1 AAA family ATPase [Muricauda sp. SYSU M84420]